MYYTLIRRNEIRWPLNELEITDNLHKVEIRNLSKVLPMPIENIASIKVRNFAKCNFSWHPN